MKHSSSILPLLSCMQIVGLLFALSGCIAKKNGIFFSQENKSSTTEEQLVQQKNQLADQKKQIIRLQMSLLEKRAEIEQLTRANERLVREFVRNNTHSWNRRSKVETVRLLAEVATVIKTVKEAQPTGHRKDLLVKAEQLLAESRTELTRDNYDGAAYLAEQAMDNIQAIRLGIAADEQTEAEGDNIINFLVPLPMKITETCNVRESPSRQSEVKFILNAGSHVTAIGYQGQWIQVKTEQNTGWIHQTLLSGEWE